MDDTVKGVRSELLEQGVDPSVMTDLRRRWEERLATMRVTATDEDKAAELLFGDAEPPAAAAPVKRERELPPAPIAAEKKVKTEGEAAADGGSDVDEESLSSLSDSDAVLQAEQSDCPNLVLCQFETVKKSGK